jgi:hypothetical protein
MAKCLKNFFLSNVSFGRPELNHSGVPFHASQLLAAPFDFAVGLANSPLSSQPSDIKVDAITDNHRGSEHQQNCNNWFGDDETTHYQKHATDNKTNA